MARLTLRWLAAGMLTAASLAAAQSSSSSLAGVWSLNRSKSEFPKELGFTIEAFAPPEPGAQPAASGGGRGGRGQRSTGGRSLGTPFGGLRESAEDAHRRQQLTDEARNPPLRLTIADNLSAVVITDDRGQSRTLHPNNKEESIALQDAMVGVTTARDGDRLIVTYHVEEDREIRYIYTPSGSPARLAVETRFLDHGKGDSVTRIYEQGTVVAAAQATGPADAARETFDQRPGAEFRGLKSVGILVEDLGPEAIACGLKRDTLEDALAKRLSAGGLQVRKNSDEDTYVYVNIITSSLPNGTCATRYDAFLYTHATAKLTYRDQPVLVQVSLMHRGGIGTSGVASHAASVSRGLENYVDLFLTQIQTANK